MIGATRTAFSVTDDTPTSPDNGLMLAFNHSDPSGAGGLAADVLAAASAGVHVLPIATAVLVRDTAGTRDLHALPADVIEDMPVKVAKLGFGGSPEALATLAEVLADYPDCLLLTYLPDLSWWDSDQIERYLDALRELLLPQSSVLVGNRDGLQRWLLPDRAEGAPCTPRDLAVAAAEAGCPYVLVTGMANGDQIVNALASPNSVILQASFERIDSRFVGAGDTLSASLAALLALGTSDLAEAAQEALTYLDRSLAAGFTPGMGRAVADRLFWAGEDDAEEDAEDGDADTAPDTPNH
jgi:hydroxymethylpyrimidine/phosphomethylpyrimidine kinase